MGKLTIDFYYQNLSKFEEMPISSQVLCDESGEIVKKLKKDNNYYVLLKCKHCGTLRIGKWHHTLYSKKLSTCTICNTNSVAQNRVGKIYGSIKVLALDHIDRIPINNTTTLRVYYLTECIRCKRQSVRLYNIRHGKNSKKCRYCDSKSSITSNSAYNSLGRTYQQGANERNINGNLTIEQFLNIVKQNCYYCGQLPTSRSKRFGRSASSTHKTTLFDTPVNGIDRLNPKLGYNVDNCVPCCTCCNFMKQSYSEKEFLEHVEKIYKHQHKKGSETIETTSKDGTE